MITLLDPLFWLNFLFFIGSLFFAFYIPGNLLIRRIKIALFENFVLSIILGMVLWGWQGYILGFLQIRWVSYFYVLGTFIYWVYLHRNNTSLNFFHQIHIPINRWGIFIGVVIFAGVFGQLSSVWFNGILYRDGLFFCCGNNGDSLYHIALTNEIVKRFPPYEPGMYGIFVHNYHYFSNLVVAELIRIFQLPLIATQYQYISFFVSLFLGFSAISLSNIIKLPRAFTAWLLFFLYFGGDLIYIFLFIRGQGLNFSMSALEDGVIFLVNPPRAFAIVVLFGSIALLHIWIRKKSFFLGIIVAVMISSLISFKVYVGIFALTGLSAVCLYNLYKRQYFFIAPTLISFLLTALLYLPVNRSSGALYYTGFWVYENYISQPNFHLERWELAKKIFSDHKNYIRVTQYLLMYIGIYWITIFGTKIIAFIQSKKSIRHFSKELNIFLLSGLIISFVGGFFFQQTSGGANTFNFIVNIFIISSLYTALACYYWLHKIPNPLKIFLIVLIISFTIPRALFEINQNIQNIFHRTGFNISNQDLQLLSYLKNRTDKNSQVMIEASYNDMETTAPYVSFMTQKNMYLSGAGIIDSHNVNTKDRKNVMFQVFRNSDEISVAKILLSENIDYILSASFVRLAATKSAYFTDIIIDDEKSRLLKFSPEKAKNYIKQYEDKK